MPYKTKFRHVDVPKNAAEFELFPRDANSFRSLGAAHYRQLAETYPIEGRCYVSAVVLAGTDLFVNNVLGRSEQKPLEYMTDGFRRAAKQAGDRKTADRLPEMIDQIKSKLPIA